MYEKPTILDKITKVISIAGHAVLMNLFFLMCSLPIVTMGQAWTGLLTAIRYNIRGDKWQTGFWKGFKTRFWRGTISWCIMLAIEAFLMIDVITYWGHWDTPLIGACLVFLLMTMLTFSLQILNVYVPTRLGDWIRSAVNMVFKVPLELIACALLFWAPYLMIFLYPELVWYAAMIFVTVYFVLSATAGTLLLKNALIPYLLEARKEGTLIDDDSKQKEDDEDEDA